MLQSDQSESAKQYKSQEFKKAFQNVLRARCLSRKSRDPLQPYMEGRGHRLSSTIRTPSLTPSAFSSSQTASSSCRRWRAFMGPSPPRAQGAMGRTEVARVCSKSLLRACCWAAEEAPNRGRPRPQSPDSGALPVTKVHQISVCEGNHRWDWILSETGILKTPQPRRTYIINSFTFTMGSVEGMWTGEGSMTSPSDRKNFSQGCTYITYEHGIELHHSWPKRGGGVGAGKSRVDTGSGLQQSVRWTVGTGYSSNTRLYGCSAAVIAPGSRGVARGNIRFQPR
ncbi:hypothetical protein JZ751_012085 [Albula glossodonta]|uniref:Uncharacterized protein n=1 Tax=Albula glossodonta TaxID=121402 RepID=A0A8T2PRN9_9TELE|nr:hypothetical protein JZ751_012085 [Albula glossodonta]